MTAKVLLYALMMCFVLSGARAEDPWANSPNRNWFNEAELTPAAAEHFKFKKCCDQSEVVRTKFRQDEGTGHWFYLDGNTWRQIPNFIVWQNKQPPENKPILFKWNGTLTCFFAPDPET